MLAGIERGNRDVGPFGGHADGEDEVDCVIGEQLGRLNGPGVAPPALVQPEELSVGNVSHRLGPRIDEALHQLEQVQVVHADHAQAAAHERSSPTLATR